MKIKCMSFLVWIFFLKKKKPGQVHETEIAKVNH